MALPNTSTRADAMTTREAYLAAISDLGEGAATALFAASISAAATIYTRTEFAPFASSVATTAVQIYREIVADVVNFPERAG